MNKKLILSMIAGLSLTLPGLAQAQNYDVRACLPAATGFTFDTPAGGTTIDFGTLEQDPTFGFFAPAAGLGVNGDGVLKVYVGPTGGTGSPDSIDLTFTDGANPNAAAGINAPGIGGKALVYLSGLSFETGAGGVDEEFLIAAGGGNTAADATLNRLDTDPSMPFGLVVEAGTMLSPIINFAIATGDPALNFAGTPAEPFTAGDAPGEYTGTVTLTATPNTSVPAC